MILLMRHFAAFLPVADYVKFTVGLRKATIQEKRSRPLALNISEGRFTTQGEKAGLSGTEKHLKKFQLTLCHHTLSDDLSTLSVGQKPNIG